MWKLWHKLFGWHYVIAYIIGGLCWDWEIKKITKIPNGKFLLKAERGVMFLADKPDLEEREVKYIPLTFKSLEDLK